MNDNFQILKELVHSSGNCVNLGRSMQVKYPSVYQWAFDETTFLDPKNKVKFNERVHCILNDIRTIQLDMFGKNLRKKM